jgi:hypothetical protein
MKTKKIEVRGFSKNPKKTAGGSIYQGRFTFHDVQWTGEGEDLLATFTITAEELADMAGGPLKPGFGLSGGGWPAPHVSQFSKSGIPQKPKAPLVRRG